MLISMILWVHNPFQDIFRKEMQNPFMHGLKEIG